ncbi:MAG: hypothetical protein HON65_06410 [Rhodospirillales bacterium]|jgi:Bax protein|nr:hypothetical protein [Rhodospirillales bacterium]
MTSFGNLTGFQKFSLGVGGGLIAASCAIAFMFPPSGTTHAPKASLENFTDVSVLPVPVSRVESEALPHLKPAFTGLSIAQVRQQLAYDLEMIRSGDHDVPRIFLSAIPHDLGDVPETAQRKALFFKSVLPLVLQANEKILAQRSRLERINGEILQSVKPPAADRLWLAMMSDRYKVERDDISALMHKVDVVPPSLALAQAAKESGWGMSRFAREGNALFGQWTFDKGNLVPDGRDEDKQHMIKSFETLQDSVNAYVFNLNTHRAYREYRALRANLRNKNKPLDGRVLAGELHRYSELGVEYVNAIRTMISYNKLNRLDDARLNIPDTQPEA